MNIKNILPILCLLYLTECKVNKKATLNKIETSNTQELYHKIAEKRYGSKVKYLFNPNKNKVLCINNKKKEQPIPNAMTDFFIFDITKGSVVYSDKIARSTITWYNNSQLLITIQKGYTTTPTDTGNWTYIFDLNSKKKITPKEHNKSY